MASAVIVVVGALAAAACGSGGEDQGDVGGQIAFIGDIEPLQDQTPLSSAIFVADSDGRNRRRLTEPRSFREEVGWLAWSPDGERIAYATGESPGTDLFVANADGTDARQLTTFPSPAGARRPVWSPDGTRIVFDRYEDGSSAIWVVRPDGSGLRQLANSHSRWHPVWLHDGRIAYVDQGGILTVSVDGGGEKRLVDVEVSSAATQARTNITASPDGKRVAYIGGEGGLWVVNADGTGRRLLYGSPSFATATPVWSPDGRRIAFQQSDVDHDHEIFVANVEEGGARNVSENQASDREPAWSPDSRSIAFVSDESDGSNIYVVDADGGQARNLTQSRLVRYESPVWRP